jgi:acyl-coenzyme A thioesterase PaaI-like protein
MIGGLGALDALADWQRDFLREQVLEAEYYRWLGVEVLGVERGSARIGFRPRREMLTPWGTLNGSVMNGLLELPSFVALLPELERGELPVTADIFVQHVRGLPGDADYVLEGRLLRRGKGMAWTEAQALVAGRPHSLARITKNLVPGPLGR